MNTTPILRATNIVKKLGGKTILNDVSLDVHKGDVKVVIGPSGAGKSTFLQCLNYLLPPDSGDIWLEGIPTYIGLRDMHMLNSPFALILPMLCSPFAFYLMYQYVETVPTEIVEAARLETSSLCKILWHALLPQVKGSVAAVFVFMFAEGFNMVEQPLYFVKEDVLRPLSVIAEEYIQGKEQLLYAVGVLCLIPILLLYAVYEEELSDGMGRLKG